MNSICYIMQEKNPELLVSIDPTYYGNIELKKLFMIIRNFYLQSSIYPGWDLVAAAVSGACKTPEKMKFMLSILDQIKAKDIEGLTDDLMLQELRDYKKFRLVLDKVAPLISAVEEKNIDATLGTLKSLYDSVFVDEEDKLKDYDMSTMPGKVMFDFRTTGIPDIDKYGGIAVKGYCIIAAPTGVGKSTLAAMICLHQYLELGLDCAYFSFEQSAQELRAKMYASMASIDLSSLVMDELTPEDLVKFRRAEARFNCLSVPEDYPVDLNVDRDVFMTKVYSEFERRPNRMYLIDADLDWDELEVKINLMASTKNIKTVCIDYPWIVKKGRGGTPGIADWQYQLEKSKMLKSLARKYDLNLIAPAQLSAGKKNEDPKLKFVSNASNDADLVLFLSRDSEDMTLGTTSIHFEKYRNFITNKDSPGLKDFKVMNALNFARFDSLEY